MHTGLLTMPSARAGMMPNHQQCQGKEGRLGTWVSSYTGLAQSDIDHVMAIQSDSRDIVPALA